MSTPEPFGVKADRPTERNLFRSLFDDAAVFPPGLAPLPVALRDHVARQASSYADLVGPLLLPASASTDLLNLEHPPVEIVLIGRPGTSPALIGEARSLLSGHPSVTVTGVEIGWSPDWRHVNGQGPDTLGTQSPGARVSVEVPRGTELESALSDLTSHGSGASPVQAKFRTGSIPGQPAPTTTELATFIRACIDRDLSFKLTGGLHHAFSRTTSSGGRQLGFLNVIAATRWGLAHGGGVPEMEPLLAQHDPGQILDIITRMSEADSSVVRAFFTSYGCCDVTDPVGDLAALGLIREKKV
ncbi:MAG: hypothetical protein ABI903_04785 [Actinomycetota bacterium]